MDRMANTTVSLVGALAVALAATACGVKTGGDDPQFTGPYAAEFRQAYQRTEEPFVRDVLSDSRITDAEFEEFKNRYASCMDGHGVSWTYDAQAGESLSASFGHADLSETDIAQAEQACAAPSGYQQILPLYESISRNPDKLDADELDRMSIECLERHELIEPGMTVAEYQAIWRDHERYQQHFGQYSDWQQPQYAEFHTCVNDPINAD